VSGPLVIGPVSLQQDPTDLVEGVIGAELPCVRTSKTQRLFCNLAERLHRAAVAHTGVEAVAPCAI
jgi:hypothetical protein